MSRKKGIIESLAGRTFGKLLVLSYAGRVKNGRNTTWLCLCDCGETAVAVGSSLKRGLVKSCGCYRRGGRFGMGSKHGHAAGGKITAEYRSWQGMRKRCSNPHEPSWPRYGGRGIRVCDRWETSFSTFLADIGPRPTKKHSLGRINNDGNYEPGNVRWETPYEQGNNNSRNRNFTIDGRTMCLAAWVRECGLVLNTVCRRLKRGMTIEQALELHGMAERARQGVRFGAPPKVSPADAKKMAHMRFKTGIRVPAIAAKFKVSDAAVYQHTKPYAANYS